MTVRSDSQWAINALSGVYKKVKTKRWQKAMGKGKKGKKENPEQLARSRNNKIRKLERQVRLNPNDEMAAKALATVKATKSGDRTKGICKDAARIRKPKQVKEETA